MTTPTPGLIGNRLAAEVFNQRAKGRPQRGTEVHLSEDDLATICTGAAKLGRDTDADALKPHNDAILRVVSTFTSGPADSTMFRDGLSIEEYAALRDLNVVRIDSGDDREPTALANPAPPATLHDVKVPGDLREQACTLIEEACARLDRTGARKAAALLRGIVAGMTDGDEVFPGGDLDYIAAGGYRIGTDASENGRGF